MTTYTAQTPADLVASLPALFGFMPTESVVFLTFYGERNRLGFRMRMDLPGPEQAEELTRVAYFHLRQQEPDSIAVIAVSGQPHAADLVSTVVDGADGLPVMFAGVADGGVFAYVDGRDPDLYEDPATSVATAMAVAEGQRVLSSRDEMVRMLAPTFSAEPVGDGPIDVALCWDALEGTVPLDAEARVALTRAARSLPERDHLAAGVTSASVATEFAAIWTAVATKAHRDDVAPVYTVAAHAAYCSGDGAQALTLLDVALQHDPAHTWAGLLSQAIQVGVTPQDLMAITPL